MRTRTKCFSRSISRISSMRRPPGPYGQSATNSGSSGIAPRSSTNSDSAVTAPSACGGPATSVAERLQSEPRMGSSRIRSIVLFSAALAAVWACGGTATDAAPTSTTASAFAFPQGDNLGFCGSNPSPECDHGTPLAPKQLVFTFDDGPGTQSAAFADWLASQGIPATFFVLGEYVSDTSVLAREEADGHLVGNHTWDHPDLTTISDSQILSEVSQDDGVIAPYVASSHFVFRAPYGAWDSEDYNVLQNSPMSKYAGPVRWDIGGEMTATYAADWDCWQNQSGYGVMTSKQCG